MNGLKQSRLYIRTGKSSMCDTKKYKNIRKHREGFIENNKENIKINFKVNAHEGD